MKLKKRVFLIVLDSVGAGELPDAEDFGDKGANTLRSCNTSAVLHIPHLRSLGLGNIEGLSFLGPVPVPLGAYGKATEMSHGKDTTTGHWEIAGLISDSPMPTFPIGFPRDFIARFSERVGRRVICNMPYSGTRVIADFGEEHMESGALIVYTSADSVFQVAAHTDVVPLDELYRICETAREMLCGSLAVGRVIARPFDGEHPYRRTPDRRDYSLEPPKPTLLDRISSTGMEVIAVGKTEDIFAGHGITESYPLHGNALCMKQTESLLQRDFHGLCFVNLVDFDMLYGHRNDIDGYAGALSSFDRWLGDMLPRLRPDDMLIITADHGCDPGDLSTDHSREYVPVLVYGEGIGSVELGTLSTLADIGATVAQALGVPYVADGVSFFEQITQRGGV